MQGAKNFASICCADCLLTPLRNAAVGMKSGFIEVPTSVRSVRVERHAGLGIKHMRKEAACYQSRKEYSLLWN